MGKLDAAAAVNGPEGDVLDWDAVDWRQVQDDVRRLRQRIFAASQAGDSKRVRNLQKLMLRSRANALLSVRRRLLLLWRPRPGDVAEGRRLGERKLALRGDDRRSRL